MLFQLLVLASAAVNYASAASANTCSTENTGSSYAAVPYTYQTIGYCTSKCKAAAESSSSSYTYAILQGEKCWCSDTAPKTTVESSQCNEACPGYALQNCGSVANGAYTYVAISSSSSSSTLSSSNSTITTISSTSSTISSSSEAATTTTTAAATATATASSGLFTNSTTAGTLGSNSTMSGDGSGNHTIVGVGNAGSPSTSSITTHDSSSAGVRLCEKKSAVVAVSFTAALVLGVAAMGSM